MSRLTRRALALSLIVGIGSAAALFPADRATAQLIFEPPVEEEIIVSEPKPSTTKSRTAPRAGLRQRDSSAAKADQSRGRWIDSNDMPGVLWGR